MKRLEKIMQKYGISYRMVEFGSSYFFDAPPISFPAAMCYRYADDCNSEKWNKFQRYCKRYGYDLRTWGGYPGYTAFTVAPAADRAAFELYAEYQKKSVDACEKAMHLRHTGFFSGESDSEFNEHLRGIMAFYESEYLQAIKAENAA